MQKGSRLPIVLRKMEVIHIKIRGDINQKRLWNKFENYKKKKEWFLSHYGKVNKRMTYDLMNVIKERKSCEHHIRKDLGH